MGVGLAIDLMQWNCSKMLSHFAKFFFADLKTSLPLVLAWRVLLCNQAACILALALLVALTGYFWSGLEMLLLLGLPVLVVQWGVVQLNREGFHRAARLGFCIGNSFLLYICSNLLGADSGFFLFYLVALIAALALFTSEEVWLRRVGLGCFLLFMALDLLLDVRLLAYWEAAKEHQQVARWTVVPSAALALAALWRVQARAAEWAWRKLQQQNRLLETFTVSSGETLLELDESLRLVNLWSREAVLQPQVGQLFLTRPMQDWLPAEIISDFNQVARSVLENGQERSFEYRSLLSGNWHRAQVTLVPGKHSERPRLLVRLSNVQSEREQQHRWQMMDELVRNHADAILLLDAAGYILACNPATERLYGYSEAELKGQSSFMLRASDDRVNLQEVEQHLQTRRSWSGETRHKRRDGSVFDVQMSLTVWLDEQGRRGGLVMMCRDHTEVKRLEEQLRWSKRRFRSMTEHVPGIVYEWYSRLDGSEAGFTYISPKVRDIFGIDPELLLQDMTLVSHAIHPDDQQEFARSIMEAVRTRSRWEHQARLVLGDDEVHWLMGMSSPVEWDDERVVYHGVLMDVTAERRYRDELMAAKERAEAASRAKAEFLSIMSHEIRTPMNAIIGLTHMLLEENPRPEQVENLSTLRFSAENLLALINDILDYNKIEAGKIQLEEIDFDLHDLLQSIIRTAQYSGQEKGLQILQTLEGEVPRWVQGDPTRLAQILSNLLSNAVKFTHRGQVELSVKRLDPGDEVECLLEFRVTDSGIGISEDNLARIFEYFTQADESITRSYGGTGLGLAITKALAERFGSEIRVESQVGVGSSFSFQLYLPYRTQPLGDTGTQLAMPERMSLSGCRILLVEDNPVNVMVAEKLLRKWGAEVDTASNGFEAIERVQLHNFDLVLMDIQMPLKDGYAAAREIRALYGDKFLRLPIIALSAATTDDVLIETVRAGMDGFLPKPINPTELRRKIFRYLRRDTAFGT